MDAQFPFANYRQHDAYTQYPPEQTPSHSLGGAYSGTYYNYAPPTPVFSPGSSSTAPTTPAVPTPPPAPTEDFRGSAYETEAQLTYGGWDGLSTDPYGENPSLLRPHIDTNVRINVPTDASHSNWGSSAMLPHQHCQPPTDAALPPAALPSYDYSACTSVPTDLPRPTVSTSRFSHPGARHPDLTDEFRTHWDNFGNLVRTPVPTTCGYPDCAFVGLPYDLWRHLVHTHHAGSKSSTLVECRWDGCDAAVTKPMTRHSLQRHILDKHLLYQKLHCPYCHHTGRDNEYVKRHGNDPAVCPERAAWEAHEGEGWALRDHCPWCQVIAPLA